MMRPSRPSARRTDEGVAREARARALGYALSRYFAKQQAAGTSGGQDDPKGTTSDKNRAERNIPR